MKSVLKQYHYLYKITNLINNKIYIGIHSTNNLDDGYFGSGKHILQAIKKYSKENFIKEILEWFDWKCEALQREEQIVSKDFIERNDTYNLKLGGEQALYFSEETRLKFGKHRIGVPSWNKGLKGDLYPYSSHMRGKNHSIQTKEKIRQTKVGENNSRYGIKHTEESLNKMRKPKTLEGKENISNGSWMRGIDPSKAPSAKSCIINNIKYSCAKVAYLELKPDIGLCQFRNRIKQGYNGWYYV